MINNYSIIMPMKLNLKKEVFLLFENNRLELHHKDGSILQWKSNTILYISPKGIKNILPIEHIHKLSELFDKFQLCLTYSNIYNTKHSYMHYSINNNASQQNNNLIKLPRKLEEFRWQNPQIQQQKDGYLITSDCKMASLKLQSDLYLIQAIYYQFITSNNAYLSKPQNMTKILLQKYKYNYLEFPTLLSTQQQTPQYLYLKQNKIFNIYNVPNQWKYPLHLIWNSLIKYQVISQPFLYFEYLTQEMEYVTTMPSVNNVCKEIYQSFNNEKQEQLTSIPILGQITHKDKCIFLKIQDYQAWYTTSPSNIFSDGSGFWSYSTTLTYKTSNKIPLDFQFHPRTLPYIIRFPNQPERSLISQLKLFVMYHEENNKINQMKQYHKVLISHGDKFDNEGKLIRNQYIDDIGQFKAYSNGVVIVKFGDRSLLTLNSMRMEAKIISGQNGETSLVNLDNPDSLSYKQNRVYIVPTLNFQEQTFYPEEWLAKQQLSSQIETAIEISNIFQKTNKTYLNL